MDLPINVQSLFTQNLNSRFQPISIPMAHKLSYKKIIRCFQLLENSVLLRKILSRCNEIDDIVFTLTSTSPSQIFLFLYLLNHTSMPLLRILVIADPHQ